MKPLVVALLASVSALALPVWASSPDGSGMVAMGLGMVGAVLAVRLLGARL